MNISPWDGFTRLYHISQITLLGLLWYTSEQGETEQHALYGYLLLALLLVRLLWGFLGSFTARFSQFSFSLSQVKSYLSGRTSDSDYISHNPLSSYMVLALLGLLFLQIISGLFSTDDVMFDGPLYGFIEEDTANLFASIHEWGFTALQVLVVVHVIAALWHSVKGENIIKKMFSFNATKNNAFYWRSIHAPLLMWIAISILVTSIAEHLLT